MTTKKIETTSTIFMDEFGNVIYSSDFTLTLGRITEDYRFIPKTNITLEQGLTARMLITISELIRDKYEKNEHKKDQDYKK